MKMNATEKMAAHSHELWSNWMQYQFTKGTFNKDGSWTMRPLHVNRWMRQSTTAYEDLPEKEKESDREEANRLLEVVRAAMAEEIAVIPNSDLKLTHD